MVNRPKPLLLLILDGFSIRKETDNNAIALAATPCLDSMQQTYPLSALSCSGDVVGLPDGQMVNSEVGHLHISSGRLLRQELSRVSHEIKDGSFFNNEVLCRAVDEALAKGKALHIMGLLSPGSVHSHETQIMGMIELAAKRGLKKIYLHAFLDGRDAPPKSADASLELVEAKFAELGVGRIVSVSGRFYAMDRDNRWERVQVAYNLIAKGEAQYPYSSARDALAAAYQRDESDEFVLPSAIVDESSQAVVLDKDDSVVFMNFRADRSREISAALTAKNFDKFERACQPHQGYYATLTEYHQDFNYPIAYPSVNALKQVGGQMLLTADHGNIEQMSGAETGQAHTAHTTDLAPTVLDILGMPLPAEMTGLSLLLA